MTKAVIVSAVVGLVLTFLFIVLAGMGGGACHCDTPLTVLFPFVSMLGSDGDQFLGAMAILLPFPAYTTGVTVAYRRMNNSWKELVLFVPLTLHALAIIVAFQVPGHR